MKVLQIQHSSTILTFRAWTADLLCTSAGMPHVHSFASAGGEGIQDTAAHMVHTFPRTATVRIMEMQECKTTTLGLLSSTEVFICIAFTSCRRKKHSQTTLMDLCKTSLKSCKCDSKVDLL